MTMHNVLSLHCAIWHQQQHGGFCAIKQMAWSNHGLVYLPTSSHLYIGKTGCTAHSAQKGIAYPQWPPVWLASHVHKEVGASISAPPDKGTVLRALPGPAPGPNRALLVCHSLEQCFGRLTYSTVKKELQEITWCAASACYSGNSTRFGLAVSIPVLSSPVSAPSWNCTQRRV